MPAWKKVIVSGSDASLNSLNVINGVTGSLFGTSSYSNNTDLLDGKDSSTFATTGSNTFRGNQTVTGSLFTTGSNTLVGSTTLTGSLLVSVSTTQVGNNTLLGITTLSGSIYISGSVSASADMVLGGHLRLDPGQDPGPNNYTASYLFTSASNTATGYDLYYRQDGNLTKFKWIEGMLNTGVLYGGVLSYSGSYFYLTSGSGIIVNHNAVTSSEINPIITYINWSATTQSIIDTGSQNTYVYIDATGSLKQQSSFFTSEQYHEVIPIGRVSHYGPNSSTITGVGNNMVTAYDQPSQLDEFVRAFGPLKISGLTITPQPGSLRINVGSGTSFNLGGYYQYSPDLPSIYNSSTYLTSSIIRIYRSGSGYNFDNNGGSYYTAVDPTKWDNGSGTLQTVGNSKWSIQRIFVNPVSGRSHIYYAQSIYNTYLDAIGAVSTDDFEESEVTKNAYVFAGYLVMEGGAGNTDLAVSGSTNAIIQAGLFRNSVGGSGGASAAAINLDDLADVSITSPSNGQALIYSSGLWVNGTPTNATTASYVLNAVSSSFATTAVSASFASTAVSASFASTAVSASFASTAVSASFATTAVSASFATQANTSFTASSADNFTVRGTLTAQTIVAQTITSSTDYVTGSTRFGSLLTDTHQFTGSVSITGSLNVVGTGITGSLFGTASRADNATSASYALVATSASFALTASYTPSIAGTTNYIAKFTAGSTIGNSQIFDDGTNVGIGTTNPAYELHTVTSAASIAAFRNSGAALGQILVGNTVADLALRILSSGDALIFSDTSKYLAFGSNGGTERMRLDTSGNVGIGTTAPVTKLEVYNATEDRHFLATGGAPSLNLGNTNSGPLYYGTLGLATATNNFIQGAVAGDLAIVNRGNISGSILFGIGASASNEKMRITPAGSVGIGTSNPSNKFVVSNAGASGFEINPTGGVSSGVLLQAYNRSTSAYMAQSYYALSHTFNVGSGGGTRALDIDSTGNVGVGTTSPITKLHVDKTSQTIGGTTPNGGLVVTDLAGSNYALEFGTDTSLAPWIQSRNATSATYYSLLLNPSGGNVGIGTTSPAATLHINGVVSIGATSVSSEGSLFLGPKNTTEGGQIFFQAGTSYTSASMLDVYNDGANPYFRILRGTNVGSDAIVAQFNLHTKQFFLPSYNSTSSFAGTAAAYLAVNSNGDVITVAGTGGGGSISGGSTNYVARWASSTTLTTGSLFDNGTNVGVGTTSPGAKLDVWGALRVTGSATTLASFESSGANVFIGLKDSSGDFVYLGNDDGDFLVQTPTSAYSTKLIVKDDGNVGIGTTSPSYKLDVVNAGANTIRVQNTANTSDAYLIAQNTLGSTFFGINATGGYIYNGGALPILFYTSGSERMRILSNGNIGIGTTSPDAALNIYNGVTEGKYLNVDALAGFAGIGSGSGAMITFNNKNDGNNVLIRTANSSRTDAAPLAVWTENNSRFIILNNGNVGIGTTTPNYKLTVVGSNGIGVTAGNGNQLYLNNTGQQYTQITFDYNSSGATKGGIWWDNTNSLFEMYAASGGGVTFHTNATERMRVTSGGNVGIGTTSPSYKLDVNGIGRFANNSISTTFGDAASFVLNSIKGSLTAGQSVAYLMGLENSLNNQMTMLFNYTGYGSTSNYLGLGFYGQDNLFVIRATGNVGINTTTPVAKLDVEGDFQLLNANYNSYSSSVSGTTTLATIPTSSYNGVFFDFVAFSGSNQRAGTLIGNWRSGTVQYTEYSTPDIGSTAAALTMSVALSGANALVQSVSAPGWAIKATYRTV